MKFILSILAVLAIVFLIGCSAKDTNNNKLSNSEITKLGKKYGGVYVFNKKFEKEIDDRERERSELKDCYENKSKTECEQVVKKQITTNGYFLNRVWNNNKDKFMKKYNSSDENIVLDRHVSHIVNKKIYPIQTLSNGKKYYTTTRTYGEDYNKQAKLPEIYKEKIINFIGQEDYNKFKPSMLLSYFYVDDNKNIIPIVVSVYYTIGYTKFGFFGDEGRGFSLSRRDVKDVGGDSIFYLEDTERK